MKTLKYIIPVILLLVMGACTKDFTAINQNPNAITPEEASARYFITNPEFELFAPSRYAYWRANLIHADRYAGYFTFGFDHCWWSDELGYKYSSSYTDATWGWMEGYFSQIDNFMKLCGPGGDFENGKMYAVGEIIKALYYQRFTDLFGMVPFTEAGNPDIPLPKFDDQNTIYQGLIGMLNKAIDTIGDNIKTGDGVKDLGENDIIFHGDLQKWKKLANALKLRLALRAYGAPGADWVGNVVKEAMKGPLPADAGDNALIPKDNEITQWASACYGDIWYNFGGHGSKWTVGKAVIDNLTKNNDPRLAKFAKPAPGGTVVYYRPKQASNPEGYDNFPKRIHYLVDSVWKPATGGDMTFTDWGDSVKISIPENKYFIGQPSRLNSKIKPFVNYNFFSTPAEVIIQKKNQGKDIFPELVMTTAESYFLQAESVVRGLATGDAQTLYQNGIRYAMKLWGVSDGDISTFLSSAAGQLTGSTDQQLEKISVQMWLANYVDGFEGWSDVRKSGYPKELARGVSDPIIFGLGDDNGVYPQRMRYGNQAYANNGDNLNKAIAEQGPDVQGTKLWWAK